MPKVGVGRALGWSAALLTLAFFTALMLRIVFRYTALRDDVGFLLLKHDSLDVTGWRVAFYLHVFASTFLLLAGFTQFSSWYRRRYRRGHRSLGYAYVGILLGVAGPSGLVLAVHANGGFIGRAAFVSLSVLWLLTTLAALATARRRAFAAHRCWMVLSFALTLSALTLRAWKYALVRADTGLSTRELYQLVAWIGFVPNLLVAGAWLWLTRSRPRGVPQTSAR